MARPTAGTYDSKIGDKVLIRMSSRAPYAGRIGVVVGINDDDLYGAILVRFSDGLQFRYTRPELLFLALLPSHLSVSSGRVA